MNRPVLMCLSFLIPAAAAQQPTDTTMASQVVVRMAPGDLVLNHSLVTVIGNSTEMRQAVGKALGNRLAGPDRCGVSAGEMDKSQPAGVFQFEIYVSATVTERVDATAEEAALQAAAGVLRRRLETMIVTGPRRVLQSRAADLEERLKQAEAQREQAAVRLLQLGAEDPAEAQKLLAELQRRRLDVELDLRTEEALQERLQKLIDTARRGLAEAGARVAAVAEEAGRLMVNVTEQRTQLQAISGRGQSDPLPEGEVRRLQKQLAEGEARFQELERQRTAATAAAEAEGRVVQELAVQATASTIALNRHASRLQVLQAATQQQEKRASDALVRAIERGKAEQSARRGDETITLIRARLSEVTQQIESLQPVRVELWR
jgi:hypothetical protein